MARARRTPRYGPVDHLKIRDGERVQHRTWAHRNGGPQRGTVIVRRAWEPEPWREISWDGLPTVTRLDADLAADLLHIAH